MSRELPEVLFYRKLSSIRELYEKVKYAIILSENFDPDQEYYVASSNQLRSALDHIFKAMDCDEKALNYEIKEAEEHLDRAGYDAYEVLASNICVNISYKMKKYSASTISQIFPEYFRDIKPEISAIKVEIGKLRTDKKIDIDLSFDKYVQNINELIEFDELVDKMIPAMEEYCTSEKRKNLIHWVITLLIAIASLIAGILVKL